MQFDQGKQALNKVSLVMKPHSLGLKARFMNPHLYRLANISQPALALKHCVTAKSTYGHVPVQYQSVDHQLYQQATQKRAGVGR
ncbi:hypothetical protein [Chitinimonas sp. BJB300]|uniref:hypothetical protein n=1 Tax=Chitinimonas sp. BJB300 TaxID=1559339 RepID=UPI000C0FEBF9|nr:hypothetical protein [Chitinimonas sp. BJB300]PHV12892.1 hypothetical protein CSQ89_03115 [Chitinimonas sp. BJB300]TSJ88461.1 hypothetical protein FG002_009785 [Chitinimonas sp. BJB300]